jgi:hypothetical protein
VAGKVTAVNGNTVSIAPTAGWRDEGSSVTTVLLTASTQYVSGPDTAATKDVVKVGSFIVAEGTLSSDGKTLTASRVVVLPAAPAGDRIVHFAGPGAIGKVTAVSGNAITISPIARPDGQASSVTTIDVTGSTQYLSKPGSASGLSAVKVGTYIAARGTLSGDGKTLTASQVVILPAAPDILAGPRVIGKVTAISGNTLTITPGMGWKGGAATATTVVLSPSTKYETRSASGPTGADRSAIKVGSYIMAEGTLSADGKTLTASRVMILPSAPMFGQFHQFEWHGQFDSQAGPNV